MTLKQFEVRKDALVDFLYLHFSYQFLKVRSTQLRSRMELDKLFQVIHKAQLGQHQKHSCWSSNQNQRLVHYFDWRIQALIKANFY